MKGPATSSPSSLPLSVSNTSLYSDDLQDVTYKTREKGPKKINQYVLGEILGEGAYGKVREAIDSNSLKRVAVKIIKRRLLKKIKGGEENLKNEISIMKKLKHANVIQLIEVIHKEEKQKIYIVLEFAGAGSLQQVINSHPNKRLPLSDVWRFFRQFIEGLEYIHNLGIIHRDIKPANLMITPDRILKISDFGVASELNQFSQSDVCTHSFGSPAFQSPQIATGKKSFSGFKLDIWAGGVTLYVLVTGQYPFQGTNVFNLYEQIAKAEYEIPGWVEKPLADLIRGMMSRDEETRFTIQQIKENEWFQTTQYNDKPLPNPLVDRWRSFSLLPYIAKAVNTSMASSDLPSHRQMSMGSRLSAVHFSGFSLGNRLSTSFLGGVPPSPVTHNLPPNTISSSSTHALSEEEHTDNDDASFNSHSAEAPEPASRVSSGSNTATSSISNSKKEKSCIVM